MFQLSSATENHEVCQSAPFGQSFRENTSGGWYRPWSSARDPQGERESWPPLSPFPPADLSEPVWKVWKARAFTDRVLKSQGGCWDGRESGLPPHLDAVCELCQAFDDVPVLCGPHLQQLLEDDHGLGHHKLWAPGNQVWAPGRSDGHAWGDAHACNAPGPLALFHTPPALLQWPSET